MSPDAALAASGVARPPASFAIEMRGGEPVYRLAAPSAEPETISARTGRSVGPAHAAEALAAAGGQGSVELVERDQWTVTQRYNRLRPFHKIIVGDAAGTELYVSEKTGELAQRTTRFERGWNWIGAVVHWIYVTPLRAQPDLWHDVVVWISGTACLGAMSGMVLGIWRLRLSRRYPHGTVTPYRGAARWHHLFGIAGGATLTTFIVSGWLSMNPNTWFNPRTPPPDWLSAYAGEGSSIGLDPSALRERAAADAKVLRFTRLGGRWLIQSLGSDSGAVTGADGAALSESEILRAAVRAVPAPTPPTVERLTAYDMYWYAVHGDRPLPVLRLRFDDEAATWLHIDPATGGILDRLDRSGRLDRWLFSALHRFDLPLLLEHPPVREALHWLLNGLAAVITLTGLIIGWRRLMKSKPRSVRRPA
ncbi:PepSY domain-containing protein [Methylobacterium gnaphalii]|uniref:Peptidase n=1 Tax=Methylobacterium gnaphalii TaxID=1010610 RepID=A0A512JPG7_9HYPH|nr:PepSY domain-containing protein [Methylobacterium gnaphalii]GEP11856.1 hypothetical protein MGN01_37010 [Methylobacterium gnaphalii]GJD71629.1 hypothetical protein MMMDOFMJ_4592 [Methylobacterium gnaphalii]GLS47176.1 hypothetical protein GCM10007885_00180 [Methylobacterium gnaphalii]